jgi:hypothetical protein
MNDNDLQTFKALVFKAVDDYAHGRLLLFELCDRIGAPFPEDKKVVSLATRVKELEVEVDSHQRELGNLLNDAVVQGESNKRLLDLSMELQERVAYAEKDRDEALKEKDEALAKAKEKSDRTGKHVGKIVKAVRDYYKGVLTEAELAHATLDVAVDLGVPKPEGRFAFVVEQKCSHCNDSGVIETGNNDLPCEHCPKGRTAVFNTMDGRQTGEQMVTQEFGRPMPAAWKKES